MPTNPYRKVTASESVKRTDEHLLVDSTAGAVTLTLQLADNRRAPLRVKRIAGANTVTITRAGTDTIEGNTSITLLEIDASVELLPTKDDIYRVVSSHGMVNVGGKVTARYLTNTATWDPAATAATQGASVSTTVTVTGAAVGDVAMAGHTAFTGAQAAALEANVSATDTVTVRLVNTTAAAVDLATGTLKVVVIK
jgi:hypothetical protein